MLVICTHYIMIMITLMIMPMSMACAVDIPLDVLFEIAIAGHVEDIIGCHLRDEVLPDACHKCSAHTHSAQSP
jgi:hypothetical protein